MKIAKKKRRSVREDRNKKTRLLLVITKSNWGGAQKYVYDVATNLSPEKYEVTVALGGAGPLKEKLDAAGIHTVTIPHLVRDVNIVAEFKVFFFLLKLIRKVRPQILHINSSKIGGIGVVAGRLMFVPRIIFTAHGFAFNENRTRIAKLITKFLYWVMIFGSTKTIAVSSETKKQVTSMPLLEKKIIVIHNAVADLMFLSRESARSALSSFSPALASWLSTHPNGTLLGTIGELHHIKGHRYAYEALGKLPHTALVVIGGGEDFENEQKIIKSLSIENRCFLLGARDNAAQYLKAFDIFILPSLSEAFSLSILEAAQSGVPIVASRVGGIPEIIEDGKTGALVQPRDSHALEVAIRNLAESPELQKKFSMQLADKVHKEFSLKMMLKKLEEVYSE